jgi:hypothetical protein
MRDKSARESDKIAVCEEGRDSAGVDDEAEDECATNIPEENTMIGGMGLCVSIVVCIYWLQLSRCPLKRHPPFQRNKKSRNPKVEGKEVIYMSPKFWLFTGLQNSKNFWIWFPHK